MKTTKKTTLVLGASTNPSRYSNMAMLRLQQHGHNVYAVGIRDGEVAGIEIKKQWPKNQEIDTITLYMNPELQKLYYDQIISQQPRRIIFNPGTENSELEALAREKGIETIEACTLVMLSTGQF
jgi:uncharacterized protein